MKRRKDSEANRSAVMNNAAMHSKETSEASHRPERPLRQNLAAGILALVVSIGIGRFAYTPLLPTMQERFALSNTAEILASTNYLGYLMVPSSPPSCQPDVPEAYCSWRPFGR